MQWIEEEFKTLNLGDKRRNKRFKKIIEALSNQPTASIAAASETWADSKATYEFLRSPRIKTESIAAAHRNSTLKRMNDHQIILAIQDTTELNYTAHPSKTGMGYLDNAKCQGLKVHSVLAEAWKWNSLGINRSKSMDSRYKRAGEKK